jgi:hypothetical protein
MDQPNERRRAAFIEWKRENKLSYASISRTTGVPESTLRSYVKGRAASMRGDTQAKIVEAYGLSTSAIFGANDPIPSLPVVGRINRSAEILNNAGEHDTAPFNTELLPGPSRADSYIAYELGDLWMPPAEAGWIVIFDASPLPAADHAGTPCLVALADGRNVFKRLRRGYTPGLWNLEGWDGSPPLEDVSVINVRPFAALIPRVVRMS